MSFELRYPDSDIQAVRVLDVCNSQSRPYSNSSVFQTQLRTLPKVTYIGLPMQRTSDFERQTENNTEFILHTCVNEFLIRHLNSIKVTVRFMFVVGAEGVGSNKTCLGNRAGKYASWRGSNFSTTTTTKGV